MIGVDLTIAIFSIVILSAVFVANQAFALQSRRRWAGLIGTKFNQATDLTFSSLACSDVIPVLKRIASSQVSTGALTLFGRVDLADQERVESTIEIFEENLPASRLNSNSTSALGRIWLRWRVQEDHNSTIIKTEWYSERLTRLRGLPASSSVEEIVLLKITDECKVQLAALAQSKQAFAGIGTAKQNFLPNFSATRSAIPTIPGMQQQGTVQLPARVYDNIEIDDAMSILRTLIALGGFLKGPITGLSSLCWKGHSVQTNRSLESTIQFSNYGKYSSFSGELNSELVMNWEFEVISGISMANSVNAGSALRISCSWTGQFQFSSGDLIRHLIDRLDEELTKAGAILLARPGMPLRSSVPKARQRSSLHYYGSPVQEQSKAFWPSMQDYNETIQNVITCLADPELKSGVVEVTPLGLPKVATGAFASVYRIKCGSAEYALRCFNSPIKDQEERYRRTSRFICADDLTYTVPLHYLEKGILIRGQWFPILKMEFVQGISIYDYIENNRFNRDSLLRLREKFLVMMQDLQRAGIAHSDLQHGNIIVRNDEFVLVDYDGMFVPELSGFFSNEKGHPNYQHPTRESKHFGPYLDNFSAWIIDSCLLCLLEDPSLWQKFAGDGESLLFRRADLEKPQNSILFSTLANHFSEVLRDRANYLFSLLRTPVEQIPYLSSSHQPPLSKQADNNEVSETSRSLEESRLPDWME